MNAQTHSDSSGLKTFGGRIKAVREARGLGLGFTAKKIDLSRTSLGQWEAGNVKNPDTATLLRFSKLAEVSLDWLVSGAGPAPDLGAARSAPMLAASRSARSARSGAPEPDDGLGIPEIAASLTAHASGLDLMPRAVWHIPNEVLELTFHSVPEHTYVMRVGNRSGADFGLQRDDYTLLDATRNQIDEPGIYLLADPEGKSARRAQVTETTEGELKIVLLADDLTRPPQVVPDGGEMRVLGRVMGVFRPL